MTRREREILAQLLDGGRVTTIAQELSVSDHTVRNHLKSIFGKLDVHSQTELIERARSEPELVSAEPTRDDSSDRLASISTVPE